MNRVCTRLPVFSSFISYGDHQQWRVPRQGNLGQCSLSLCPWVLHCGHPELYSVEGSPRISCASLLIIHLINIGGCHSTGTLGYVPLASLNGCCIELHSVEGSSKFFSAVFKYKYFFWIILFIYIVI